MGGSIRTYLSSSTDSITVTPATDPWALSQSGYQVLLEARVLYEEIIMQLKILNTHMSLQNDEVVKRDDINNE